VKSSVVSYFKMTLYSGVISLLIVIPVVTVWASSLTPLQVNEWKMWINLAINGYAEPMPRYQRVEQTWWKLW